MSMFGVSCSVVLSFTQEVLIDFYGSLGRCSLVLSRLQWWMTEGLGQPTGRGWGLLNGFDAVDWETGRTSGPYLPLIRSGSLLFKKVEEDAMGTG